MRFERALDIVRFSSAVPDRLSFPIAAHLHPCASCATPVIIIIVIITITCTCCYCCYCTRASDGRNRTPTRMGTTSFRLFARTTKNHPPRHGLVTKPIFFYHYTTVIPIQGCVREIIVTVFKKKNVGSYAFCFFFFYVSPVRFIYIDGVPRCTVINNACIVLISCSIRACVRTSPRSRPLQNTRILAKHSVYVNASTHADRLGRIRFVCGNVCRRSTHRHRCTRSCCERAISIL
jgi:hypothetical protein